MEYLQELLKQHLLELNEHKHMKTYHYPGYRFDHLYDAGCDQLQCFADKILSRKRITDLDQTAEAMGNTSDNARRRALDEKFNAGMLPRIYLGAVASGNKVMKNGTMRDDVAKDNEVIALEMEGAGVWSTFPTVVIKAACDYADSHKNKRFQNYASMVAAACAKAFLEQLQMGLPGNVMLDAVGASGPAQSRHQRNEDRQPVPTRREGEVSNIFSGNFTGTNFGMGQNYTSQGDMYFGSSPGSGNHRA
ncbi:hypothetical protein OHC33_005982 [Knufia fluminis]|uniref:Uncharacterized protein n=1 Tax=Knufia fluminis TaxID=191047 RepID=A0AAN8ESU9_9EURO|nr:hypothetical protein OHC33_005982 [Knufia fluminis]